MWAFILAKVSICRSLMIDLASSFSMVRIMDTSNDLPLSHDGSQNVLINFSLEKDLSAAGIVTGIINKANARNCESNSSVKALEYRPSKLFDSLEISLVALAR